MEIIERVNETWKGENSRMKKKKTETNTEKRIQETSKTMAKQEKGITLVALVITIIIIIIKNNMNVFY